MTVDLQRMWLPALADALISGRIDVAISPPAGTPSPTTSTIASNIAQPCPCPLGARADGQPWAPGGALLMGESAIYR